MDHIDTVAFAEYLVGRTPAFDPENDTKDYASRSIGKKLMFRKALA
jgi:hypothetical protein